MPCRFKVSDKVTVKRLNKRTPLYIRDALRLNRVRTITGIYYDRNQQHMLYHLGNNRMALDISSYGFRAEQLELARERRDGRKRVSRKIRASKCKT